MIGTWDRWMKELLRQVMYEITNKHTDKQKLKKKIITLQLNYYNFTIDTKDLLMNFLSEQKRT